MKKVLRALYPAIHPQRPRRHVGSVNSVTAAVLAVLYGAPAAAAPAPAPVPNDDSALQEVVVTASRRAVSAQDLPISITAVSGEMLAQAGIQDMAGLAHSMAGVNYTDRGPFGGVNGSTLIMRGLNSESLAFQEGLATSVVPPVATYVDDTALFFNMRLQDLDRVEVLRGPQGTLYGSGSLGGTIRFVLNAPDPTGFDAKAEAGLSKTAHTHTTNEDINGMINLPLSETLAVRINAGASDDAGFINQTNLYVLDSSGVPELSQPTTPGNPVGLQIAPKTYSQDGVNSYQYRNARVALLWKPSDDFKAQLSYLYQRSTANGFPYIATGPLAFTQPIAAANQFLPNGTQTPASSPPVLLSLAPATVPAGTDRLTAASNSLEGTVDDVNVVALNLDYNMGFATFTSSSSWAHHNNTTHDDLTAEYANFNFYQNLYGQNPRNIINALDQDDDKIYAQEFRLASKTGGTFDWIAGLFYKDEKTFIQEHEYYPGYNAFYNACTASGLYAPTDYGGINASTCGAGEQPPGTVIDGITNPLDQAYIGDIETSFKDIAAFGELTWHLTSDWSLTGGTRVFKQTVSQAQQTGLLFDGVGFVSGNSLSDQWRKALWKVNTSYQLDKSNLVYATWSQGFRRGGVNALPPDQPVPARQGTVGTTCPAGGPNAGLYCLGPSLLTYQPDKADNYEVGIKGVVENRVSYSAAIYDIQWHNVQEGTSLTPLSLPSAANVGDAYSRGLELETTVSLTRHLAVRLGYTYDETKLTSFDFVFSQNVTVPLPPPGGPLPGTPKSSAALSFEYAHQPFAGGELLYAVDSHYQSKLLSSISETAPIVPGYTMLDGRITFTRSHWLATAYVDNITNTLGVNAITDPTFWGNRTQEVISRPRTFGMTVGYSFKGY
ncbi:MAG TPA: TonB-dependent receptor [Steroidobacteraceae bacterium]|nr:TonB-dependent receptor [Steroidobacteraceae bacterium]